jgi:hypothetical protein
VCQIDAGAESSISDFGSLELGMHCDQWRGSLMLEYCAGLGHWNAVLRGFTKMIEMLSFLFPHRRKGNPIGRFITVGNFSKLPVLFRHIPLSSDHSLTFTKALMPI